MPITDFKDQVAELAKEASDYFTIKHSFDFKEEDDPQATITVNDRGDEYSVYLCLDDNKTAIHAGDDNFIEANLAHLILMVFSESEKKACDSKRAISRISTICRDEKGTDLPKSRILHIIEDSIS